MEKAVYNTKIALAVANALILRMVMLGLQKLTIMNANQQDIGS